MCVEERAVHTAQLHAEGSGHCAEQDAHEAQGNIEQSLERRSHEHQMRSAGSSTPVTSGTFGPGISESCCVGRISEPHSIRAGSVRLP